MLADAGLDAAGIARSAKESITICGINVADIDG